MKKIHYIILLILTMLGLASTINAQLTDDLYVHHMFQNNTLDSSGAGRTGTLTLGTYVPGKVGNGILIDASNEYFTFATLTGIYDTDISICAWISNNDATAYLGYSVNTGHGGTNNVLNLGLNSNVIGYYDGSWRNSGTAFQTGWRFVCWVFDDSSAKYEPWLDNVNLGNVTYGGLVDLKGVFTINRNGQSDLSATVDEFSVWNRTITATEISLLYNSGNGLNFSNWTAPAGALTFLNISTNNVTLLNNSYYNITQLNFTTLINASGTNNQTNQTFYLHNSTGQLINSTQFATNTLSGSFKLNLSEGIYNIWVFGNNNESNVSSSNYTFTIDITAPVIKQISNVSNNTYSINFSNILNVTDALSGISSCLLNITELENVTTPDNFVINCTDTQVFNTSGLHNGYVTAVDNAGNTATYSFNFSIIPFIYVNFKNNITNASITNYNVIIYHPDGRVLNQSDVGGLITLSPINNGSLDLGVHTLTFVKSGYVITNYTVNITASSGGTNYTFFVNPVTLSIKMFDVEAPTTQLFFNVTILNSTDSVLFTNQSNFSKQYGEIPSGSIEIVIESFGYSDAYFYQTILPFTSISIIGYMINTNNTDVVTFSVVDRTTEQALENVVVEAQELINGSYTTISQGNTDISGTTFIFLDITKVYKFIFSKNGYVSAVSTSIPGTTEYTVRLQEEGSTFNFIDGVSYSLSPSDNVLYNGKNYTFKGFISGVGITLSNYTIYNQTGGIIYNAVSTNPTGTTFTYTINNFNATQYTSINQTLTYYKDSNVNTLTKFYRTTSIGVNSFIYYLKYEFANNDDEQSQISRFLIMLISFGGTFLVGRKVGANLLGNSIFIVIVSGWFAYIEWLPGIYFGAIAVIATLTWASGGILK